MAQSPLQHECWTWMPNMNANWLPCQCSCYSWLLFQESPLWMHLEGYALHAQDITQWIAHRNTCTMTTFVGFISPNISPKKNKVRGYKKFEINSSSEQAEKTHLKCIRLKQNWGLHYTFFWLNNFTLILFLWWVILLIGNEND